jgi:hypothetical protein
VSVGLVNVNSLISKVNYVSHWIEQEGLSVVSVCETWLVASMSSSFVAFPGFRIVRGEVEGETRKHGTCLYVSNHLAYVPVDVALANVACVHLVDIDVFVLSVYHPPSYSYLHNANLISFYVNFV